MRDPKPQSPSPKDSPFSRAYVLYAIGLIFFVSVFNVVDRYILSILAPGIQKDLSLSDTQMGLLLGPSFSAVHFLAVLPAAGATGVAEITSFVEVAAGSDCAVGNTVTVVSAVAALLLLSVAEKFSLT